MSKHLDLHKGDKIRNAGKYASTDILSDLDTGQNKIQS